MRFFRRNALPWLVLLLAVTAAPVAVHANDSEGGGEPDADALAREIRDTLAELQDVRAERREADRTHGDAMGRLQRQIDRLEQDVDRVSSVVDEQTRTVRTQQDQLDELTTRQERSRAWLTEAAAAGERLADTMHTRIERGIPWQRDRRAGAAARARDTLTGESSDQWAPALASLMEFVGDELQAGSAADLENRPITLNAGQSQTHAWVLRLGLAGAVFVSEDGRTAGVAAAGEDGWRVDLSGAERDAVTEAVSVRRQQAAPRLIAVPYAEGER